MIKIYYTIYYPKKQMEYEILRKCYYQVIITDSFPKLSFVQLYIRKVKNARSSPHFYLTRIQTLNILYINLFIPT